MIKWHYWKDTLGWGFWIRIFGYGFVASTLLPTFSERLGITKVFKIGNIKIKLLDKL